ncbi:MAG: hypothetical protein GY898_16020 [Proteobacteria bacterium]|nr:hypothetical protein [Pseudomonadota bacterium]
MNRKIIAGDLIAAGIGIGVSLMIAGSSEHDTILRARESTQLDLDECLTVLEGHEAYRARVEHAETELANPELAAHRAITPELISDALGALAFTTQVEMTGEEGRRVSVRGSGDPGRALVAHRALRSRGHIVLYRLERGTPTEGDASRFSSSEGWRVVFWRPYESGVGRIGSKAFLRPETAAWPQNRRHVADSIRLEAERDRVCGEISPPWPAGRRGVARFEGAIYTRDKAAQGCAGCTLYERAFLAADAPLVHGSVSPTRGGGPPRRWRQHSRMGSS